MTTAYVQLHTGPPGRFGLLHVTEVKKIGPFWRKTLRPVRRAVEMKLQPDFSIAQVDPIVWRPLQRTAEIEYVTLWDAPERGNLLFEVPITSAPVFVGGSLTVTGIKIELIK